MAGARHALGGFDGEEGLARPCPAVDEDARGVVEDIEDDALLLGELVELLADVVEEGVGGGDEVEQIGSNVCRQWSMTGCVERDPEPAPSPCGVA